MRKGRQYKEISKKENGKPTMDIRTKTELFLNSSNYIIKNNPILSKKEKNIAILKFNIFRKPLPNNKSTRPSMLKIEAAGDAIDIHYFAGKV